MSFNNFWYNLSEHTLSRLFYVVTGINLKYRDSLDEIWIYQLEEIDPNILKEIKEKIWNDFKIKTKEIQEKIEIPKKAKRGNFIITSEVARIINERIEKPNVVAILCISKKAITPFPFLFTRIIQTIFPILGASYIMFGICFITTYNDKLPQNIINYAAVHEVGHLLGRHGYPSFS
ncbi:MAG: hypothetical protein ACTSO9_04905 [Candidatus Helarchaeota archaeon]